MKKINLENILLKHMESQELIGGHGLRVKQSMLDFGKQLLELAAENAEINSIETSDDSSGFIHEVDKQSIIDTIKEVE